ncbi:MAG: energy-coupling factor transporter ATPase [Clostridia bacterium]|nr:energy-coupling factor transporter ATPase [Clostridia bacterium]
MIELVNVNYTYEDKTPDASIALKDVCFRVNEGETWGIIGHTGSGKSTLTEIMSGLLKPCSGKVLFDGLDVTKAKNPAALLKGKVGLVFQYPEHQLFEESIIEDICFGPKNMGLSREECLKRAREAMRLVGLDESYENLSPFEISGGEKRRVAIAGIVAMSPEVLILDEPTAGLDPVGRDMLFEMLCNIKGKLCKSIIFVSHSMDDVALFADKVLVMNGGEVLLKGDVNEVFEKSSMLEEAGLDVPQVTRLIARLKEKGHRFDGAILTVEDAAEAIYSKLKG